ncbi:hypothetical protein [Microlunatus sp. GCM10028923]|uniref:hypothetical protein n=1 Tax=Microlunatus sp. GCM10028923 TaxID=3273400 RepID=UPI00361F65CF
MKRKERKRLAAFVQARTEELADPALRESHRALLALSVRLRKEATRDADWDWVESAAFGAADWFGGGGGADWADEEIGDSIFGDDPESEADALTVAIQRALALAHAGHPDYDPAWRPRLRR